MKIKVDHLKCDTTGACVKKYPQLFRFQEGSKKAEFMYEIVPLKFESKCPDILKICPMGAIYSEC
ncbi:MAG: hypothetical protein GX654_19010 [Desulfatiglans sp.]|nr:hypothetical protein [Desulfatiglans sp.]